ncbi:MAG: hypothetical protein KC477_04800 [Oceanospirillaceae bacterium]|nr:hypothetical protein [Oceanospirillaceae bacterium]
MNKDLRICFIGDSFVNGTGDETKLGWTGRVSAQLERDRDDLEVTHYNLGIRRNTSEDILNRWSEESTQRLEGDFGKLLVFSFGVNDTVIENGDQRVSKHQCLKNAHAILTSAASECRVLMIGPPPIADSEQNIRIKDLDASLALLCQSISVPYLSVVSELVDDPIWMQEVASNDGAHPKSAGYTKLATLVSAWDQWDCC